MSTNLPYVDQPARRVMRAQKRKITRTALLIGVPYLRLARALEGKVRPCDTIRDKLPVLLGVPLEELFDEALLAKPFNQRISEGMGV